MFGLFRKAIEPLGREKIAQMYLKGRGIEIGALHSPLRVPASAKVTYVDRLPESELSKHYPELNHLDIVHTDVTDDGEKLAKFGDATQDFVIANHFLEHCQDPIRAIENFLRVLKRGGILYMAVPDKRSTFDSERPTTVLEHLLRDHQEGALGSRRQHFEEWIRIVNKVGDQSAEEQIRRCMETDYSIHYHAWTQAEMFELLAFLKRELRFPFEVELFKRNKIDSIEECIYVIRKT